MGDQCKPNLRIDWFDGTLVEDARPSTTVTAFDDEDQDEPPPKPVTTKNRTFGFKGLQYFSFRNPRVLNLELSNSPGFWDLLDSELKEDFIVLIVKVLAKLYKVLEPRDRSRIAELLKTRFEASRFLDVLIEYVDNLPDVRVVDKCKNQQLWDDVEIFFSNLLVLCEGICTFGCHSLDFMRKVSNLVTIAETSMEDVREEHTETFSKDLYLKIKELKTKFSDVIENENRKNTIVSKDPLHFTNLNIFPSKEDLLEQNNLNIKPNIVSGAYANVQEYLDLQFKLLREDCFGPLREGISKYRENPKKRRHENIRVHPKVRIIRIHVSNNKVGHLVDIAWDERVKHTDIKRHVYNKQLMFGSLLLFTSDDFKTVLCATVLDSSIGLLSEGYIVVQFQNPVSNKIFTEAFTMVESEVFFEPYHRVLKVLQQSRLDNLPMGKYIVDVQTQTQSPKYLSHETVYTMKNPKKDKEISFPVLNTQQWPECTHFGLDSSQMEAYKLALSREFAVIQGPPGTGKTFIGIKIASTILKNLSLEGTPMLIICYTNHALDQFLEGILQTTTNIIRLGSQSKSEILEPYNLNRLRTKTKSKYSYLYVKKRKELEKIFSEMSDLQGEIEKCERNILCYNSVKKYLTISGQNYELRSSKNDPILCWLFNEISEENDDKDDWEKHLDDSGEDDTNTIEVCFSEKILQNEISSLSNSKKYIVDITDDESERREMEDKFDREISKIRSRMNIFKIFWSLYQTVNDQELKLEPTGNLYDLNQDDRWKLYFAAVNKVTEGLIVKMNELQKQHNIYSKELEEVSTLIDGEVMKTARVVGVTTTTAARRHDLMKNLLSPIVIVEEAAEVLEAHIVASLTQHCEHLILIGDHKQLRPTAAHYKLAKHYNLEISLFERMIRNGIHARTLSIQRRMRPNFVELLVPMIYEKLGSHEVVTKYSNVRGMADNLYFFNHKVYEDSEGLEDSWSHKNTYEASWCVSLANYLRRMKYNANEITILSTYTGQAALIRDLSKKYDLLQDIKITVIDNYQGEENRIVILSLVRSNRDGNIGFLSASNRICVALSRAKEGFFLFGNMDVMMSACSMWRQINDKLLTQNAIGSSLRITCEKHFGTIHEVSRSEDLDSYKWED